MSDYKTKNLEHFDKRAAQYDSASKEELARRIADAFIAAEGVKWDANSTTVVDFACGTGLISNKLLPHVKKVVGVDISQGMINVFDQKIAQSNSKDKMQAVCIDIMSIPYSEIPEELTGVDVVVCSMAYHHIDNVDHATKVLASLLKKGGHLLVIDLFADENTVKFHQRNRKKGDGHGHGHGHSHGHRHGHSHGHSHTEGHSHGHGHEHGHKGEPFDGDNHEGVEGTIPNMGGLSFDSAKKNFNSSGLLENVSAKIAFAADMEGIELSFILASGVKSS